MKCAEAEPMMIDAVYGELRSHDRSELTSHVAGCSECQGRLGRFRAVLGAMNKLAVPLATGRIAPRALNRVDRERVKHETGVPRTADRQSRPSR